MSKQLLFLHLCPRQIYRLTKAYLKYGPEGLISHKHGKQTAFYFDKHAVFKVNSRDAKTAKITQFGRALNDLNIELICANSSQAKGRVERANKTLQDPLIKDMRLKGIDNMTDAIR